jgi:hypothetical protein
MKEKINRFHFFTPLMHRKEWEFVQRYLDDSHTLFEWGCGGGTLFFSGLVDKLISIEHDQFWYDTIRKNIEAFGANNIDLRLVPSTIKDRTIPRYGQFRHYIEWPVENKINFHRVLIDGRARKECAHAIWKYINQDVVVFIHDFNFNNPEGYEDLNYHSDILKDYTIIDFEKSGRGIVALKTKWKNDNLNSN